MRRRDYAGDDDLLAMQHAVQRRWTPGSRWHLGDLAWRRYAVPGMDAAWHTALWSGDDDSVAAWGWVQSPGHLDLHVDPADPWPLPDVLSWFDEVATADGRTVTVMQGEGRLAAALRASGYRPAPDPAPFFHHHLLDLGGAPPAPRLPGGYRIRAVRPGEAQARAAAHRSAWRPRRIGQLLVPPVDLGDAPSGVTTAGYQAVMNAWPYRHDLDLVVEAPDGAIAAFALGWLDDVNRVGELEPVGTDPGHARRGLGAAVSLACLRALRRAGARRAVVYPRGDAAYPVPGRLYRRLGFRPVGRTVTWMRPAGDPSGC